MEISFLLFFQSTIAPLKPTLPLQVVASRIYQLLEAELTNSALEYDEEMRQIREDFKNKPWITEEFITKVEKVVPQRKLKRKEVIVTEVPASYEDEIYHSIAPERKKKRPNAELISAIKDVVRKFKASLDRTGVQDDVRQMSTQLESTWNDLRRGINRSWTAFRQSAETALLSPSLTTSASLSQHPSSLILSPPPPPSLGAILPPPPPGTTLLTGEPYPYIITSAHLHHQQHQQQQQQMKQKFMKDSNNNGDKEDTNNNDNNNTNMFLQNDINSNNNNNNNNGNGKVVIDTMLFNGSGKSQSKLESWIERAQQMLADSVSEDDVKALLEAQKGNQKIAKNPAAIFPKEKPNKSSNVIKAEKINPKFNNEFNHTK
uniref:Uncharacterized protein n=1 Tax=Panagrolaimus superbus TaxID=310955 RepID=A0A914ZAP1_9BILA